ncbi:MAG: Rieske 2Fe-2S domain-containing protein [Chloroflexota bacterium]
MLKAAENEMLTRVGPGTPAGEWLRRYWHPIAISDRWDGIKTLWACDEPVVFRGRSGSVSEMGHQLGTFSGKPTAVRVLGEDLVLFRDGSGRPGLLGLRCPHRGASLEYGRVQPDGLECCYHAWKFDVEGACLAQPAEPSTSSFKEKVRHLAHPVRELGGLIWAYLGPGEPPALPKLDVVARQDGVRAVENFGLWPVNYMQILENSPDTTHTGILHAGTGGERSDIWGREIPVVSWEEDEYGIICRQQRTNYNRASHVLLPTVNRLAQPWPGGTFKGPRYSALWRTPVDDTHTLVLSVVFTPDVDGHTPDLPPGLTFDITEQLSVHRLQDYQAIVSQGEIFDRTSERLGASDEGVILLRKMIFEAIEVVRRGGEPKGVYRGLESDQTLDCSREVVDSLLVPAGT